MPTVSWNYGRRGGLSDDSIEIWNGDERIARYAGVKEAIDMLALSLLGDATNAAVPELLDIARGAACAMPMEDEHMIWAAIAPSLVERAKAVIASAEGGAP